MRIWIKGILALLCIGLLVWLFVGISSFTLDILNAFSGHSGEHDPMFAEEIEYVQPTPKTQPEEAPVVYQDNSANWDTSVQTPVDRTAEELAEEEADGNQ